MSLLFILKTIAVGFAAGYFSGQFGVGGGLITTPAIRLILDRSAAVAIGTPLVVIIPSVLTGAVGYYRHGSVDKRLVWPLAISGLFGVISGAALTAYVSAHLIMLITAMVIFLTGLKFLVPKSDRRKEEEEDRSVNTRQSGNLSRQILVKASLAGFAAGLFSGFLGLGGGVILIPLLVYVFGQEMKKALGTSLVCISVYALPGAVVHFFLRHVDLSLALVLITGAVPGAYIGSKIALKTADKTLRLLFGLFLVILSFYFGLLELCRLI